MTLTVTRPPWTRWAACRGHVDLFYDSSPVAQRVARAICGRCGVKSQCLEAALQEEAEAFGRSFGIRGGLSAQERDDLRSRSVA